MKNEDARFKDDMIAELSELMLFKKARPVGGVYFF
jgi:hypothetical protein